MSEMCRYLINNCAGLELCVEIACHTDFLMAEGCADGLNPNTFGQQEGGVRVPEVMKPAERLTVF